MRWSAFIPPFLLAACVVGSTDKVLNPLPEGGWSLVPGNKSYLLANTVAFENSHMEIQVEGGTLESSQSWGLIVPLFPDGSGSREPTLRVSIIPAQSNLVVDLRKARAIPPCQADMALVPGHTFKQRKEGKTIYVEHPLWPLQLKENESIVAYIQLTTDPRTVKECAIGFSEIAPGEIIPDLHLVASVGHYVRGFP